MNKDIERIKRILKKLGDTDQIKQKDLSKKLKDIEERQAQERSQYSNAISNNLLNIDKKYFE